MPIGLCTLLKLYPHKRCLLNLVKVRVYAFVVYMHLKILSLSMVAGLRRSFRLSRKDRQGSTGECSDPGDSEYLTYEEVTRYQQRPHERPRLVVLIGEARFPVAAAWNDAAVPARSLTLCFHLKVLLERE